MRVLGSILDASDEFDVAVLDQWGVLHDGTTAYPDAAETVARLRRAGKAIVVLSNSGKRAGLNADRIRGMGFEVDTSEVVTSGEALWRDTSEGRLPPHRRVFAVEGCAGDAASWAEGLDIAFTQKVEEADAVLLMGLSEGATAGDYDQLLERSLARCLPLICSNPDRQSPRSGGGSALQPGALAWDYARRGGRVLWYGKPHEPIFRSVERLHSGVPPTRHLMIGDSAEHDIAGGHAAGWQTCLVLGGLHAQEIDHSEVEDSVRSLCERHGTQPPDIAIPYLA